MKRSYNTERNIMERVGKCSIKKNKAYLYKKERRVLDNISQVV